MATITVFDGDFNIVDIANAWDEYPWVATRSTSKYTLKDDKSLGGIELYGTNFTYDGPSGPLSSGIVSTVKFFNYDGSVAWTISGLTLSAKQFRDAASDSYSGNIQPLLTLFANVNTVFKGGDGDDVFWGSALTDNISGGYGEDYLTGGFGNDTISGGGVAAAVPVEFDTLDYSRESGGGSIRVDLTKNTVIDSYGTTDKISGFEIIVGGDANDTFIASSGSVYQGFVGGRGDDIFRGGAGKYDVVHYDLEYYSGVRVYLNGDGDGKGYAFDTFNDRDSLTGIDIVRGTRGGDTLVGSAAAETFTGGSGEDKIDGGSGFDTVDYGYESGDRAVSVNLGAIRGIDTYGYIDELKSIENVIGSGFADRITGSAATNRLDGRAGHDVLRGLGGNDTLIGGNGNDRLTGGTGSDKLFGGAGYDTFIFESALGSANVDTIGDFNVVADTIWLENAIFTKLVGTGQLTAGQFYKSAAGVAIDADDRIIYETDTGKLFYDSNGKAAGGVSQIALLSKNLALTAADFFVI
ncbi:hypothetical protein GB928_014100 [Shinella curvata]|uniref:Hemolysin type calcium-binding protein n=1 Tax=Shinella curvata TaxID=1817964 RepID=A0ABT8XEX8_9HYPH|nr:calcium-binding protein [Shinella curvata]MCJ8052990.1 hypothetical protein [Shinella curvata]MDO6122321.1 hypothetical protein [Shinella curvata]